MSVAPDLTLVQTHSSLVTCSRKVEETFSFGGGGEEHQNTQRLQQLQLSCQHAVPTLPPAPCTSHPPFLLPGLLVWQVEGHVGRALALEIDRWVRLLASPLTICMNLTRCITL